MFTQARAPSLKKVNSRQRGSSLNEGMATSDSDTDFESADEELGRGAPVKRNTRTMAYWTSPMTVDSDSDDEYIQRAPCGGTDWQRRSETFRTMPDTPADRKTLVGDKDDKIDNDVKVESDTRTTQSVDRIGKTSDKQEATSSVEPAKSTQSLSTSAISAKDKDAESVVESSKIVKSDAMSKVEATETREVSQTKQRQDTSRQSGAKKLGTRLTKDNVDESRVTSSVTTKQEDKCSAKCSNEKLLSVSKDTECKLEEKSKTQVAGNQSKLSSDLSEMDVPEELNSNKKFKEIFQPEGWEGLGDEIELPDELTEEKLQPVLQRLSLTNAEESRDENSLGTWGNWGNWGVTSLINTATASVSTLTNHVSQGLTLLEGTIGAQDSTELSGWTKQDATTISDDAEPEIQEQESTVRPYSPYSSFGFRNLMSGVSSITKLVESTGSKVMPGGLGTIGAQDSTELEGTKQDATTISDDAEPEIQEQESTVRPYSPYSPYSSFGFGNLMSGVSSITKLVESTGSKVMTGGLDTLEAIGKKTMEVLQDGDPGLKKKRAFFMNEPGKPNLSQVLREAKEKAETEEKTIEERELARKVHFESLFDDYQGLVHLEAQEMLSKQSSMKIQQYLIELDTNDLTSVQETLEEIKELCDLGDEDDEDKEDNKDLKSRLENACHELGVDITYEKLHSIWTETESYLASSSTHTDQEIFQKAISTLAQFTAFSVERFHKTAELLLIKERRSTVNEADALVQLTNILSDQISLLANSFCDTLHQFVKSAEKPDNITANITTIFLEAANANSYVQDAFRLFIPILQVGAI